jgi:hypothetical protein
MNNTERSAIDRWIEHTRGLANKEALNAGRGRFPSYLRVFGNFFQICAAKLSSVGVQHFDIPWMRFSAAIFRMAFV